VKDALAVLRIVENPRDEVSWFRVLQLLDGVGGATARRALSVIAAAEGEALEALAGVRMPAAALASRDELAAAIRDLRADPAPSPAAQLERVRRFLDPLLRKRYDDAEPRLRDLEQLQQVAAGFASRAAFVAELTIDPPSSTADLAGPPLLDEDFLVLSTIHSAKGGEWDVVHVLHAADGMIPSDMATGDDERIDEERRLFYVALTRARHALHVYFPLRYHRRNRGAEDRHLHAQLTRFLDGDVLGCFDRRSTWSDEGRDDRPEELVGASTAVEAQLRSLWSA
jgi:DNA helicase-2/ATP-dependent DNA helicase PcrA